MPLILGTVLLAIGTNATIFVTRINTWVERYPKFSTRSRRRSWLALSGVSTAAGLLVLLYLALTRAGTASVLALPPLVQLAFFAASVDLKTSRIPLLTNLLAGSWVMGVTVIVALIGEAAVLSATYGVLLWGAPLLLGTLLGAVGLGDVLFAIPLGYALGLAGGTAMAMQGFVVYALLAGLCAILLFRKVEGGRFPLGPCLWGGFTWAVVSV